MTSLKRPHHHTEFEEAVWEAVTLALFGLLFLFLAFKAAGLL